MRAWQTDRQRDAIRILLTKYFANLLMARVSLDSPDTSRILAAWVGLEIRIAALDP